ncbi:hypothetical protein H920_16130 [Fukomys damarensis]|uniref:Uncharacterized protein n=1 Tax=Fukomys damarensis TaxID=885580 RepID=A0A091CSU6_FUKDA|nr:hypothetical protein H920_16130 [Fukomys damarensis]
MRHNALSYELNSNPGISALKPWPARESGARPARPSLAAPAQSGSGRKLLWSALSGVPSELCSVCLSAWEEEGEEEEKKEEVEKEVEEGDEEEEDDDVWSRLGGGAAATAAAAAASGKGEAGETETWKPQSVRDPARQAPFQLHGQSVETADVPSVRHLLLPPVSASEGFSLESTYGAHIKNSPLEERKD